MGRAKMLSTNQKRGGAVSKYYSLKKELASLSSNKENTPLNFFSQLSNKSTRANTHFSSASGHSKKINVSAFALDTFLDEAKNYEKQSQNSKLNKFHRSKSISGRFNDISNTINEMCIEDEEASNKKTQKQNLKKIYSNEFMGFRNEVSGKIHYVKQYKEDEINFTKSDILPEIQWQELDNDVLTSSDQKKRAQKKEMNWIGDAIDNIQNNEKYLKNHVTMYKYSLKYPSGKN